MFLNNIYYINVLYYTMYFTVKLWHIESLLKMFLFMEYSSMEHHEGLMSRGHMLGISCVAMVLNWDKFLPQRPFGNIWR